MTLELRPNEYVKIEAHFSFKVFVIPTLLMSIGIIMFLAVWSGVGEGEHINLIGHVYSVAGIMMFIGGLLFIPYIYKRVDNRLKIYAVTNQRVYVRRGIINIKEKDIPLAKINDVQIVQSLIQRLFGAGDAIVQVGNDESSMVIHDIAHPREFRDITLHRINFADGAAGYEEKAGMRWHFPLPYCNDGRYGFAARAARNAAPTMPGTGGVAAIQAGGVRLTFPAGEDDDFVHSYQVVIDGGETRLFFSDFYNGLDAMAKQVTLEIKNIPHLKGKHVFEVYAVDSWGAKSACPLRIETSPMYAEG